jgi:hypothetical protein
MALLLCITQVALTYFVGTVNTTSPDVYYPSLDLLLPVQNLYFVFMIGAMVVAPEAFYAVVAQMSASGSEFLLTRAVDRHLILRARIAFFYLLILAVPCMIVMGALTKPDLQIGEYHKTLNAQIVANLPGSIAAPPDKYGGLDEITVPRGNLLLEGWHLWILLISGLVLQMTIILVYPFKYRRFVLWTLFLGIVLLPIFFDLRNVGINDENPTWSEALFFSFVAHQPLLWILTSLALILGQIWCERRFARLEQ